MTRSVLGVGGRQLPRFEREVDAMLSIRTDRIQYDSVDNEPTSTLVERLHESVTGGFEVSTNYTVTDNGVVVGTIRKPAFSVTAGAVALDAHLPPPRPASWNWTSETRRAGLAPTAREALKMILEKRVA